ncbi:UPF0193 protein EVG1-like isoform X2 [Panulirus ornatus]|uniref:UPF0193 protein EVG1-like isoform X2 n=1 Tax=Panulirus ornatus TaxID=150431 RepID=UPI003A8A46B3
MDCVILSLHLQRNGSLFASKWFKIPNSCDQVTLNSYLRWWTKVSLISHCKIALKPSITTPSSIALQLLQEAAVNSQHQRYIERWVGSGSSLPHHRALAAPSQTTPRHARPSSTISTPRPHIQTKRSHQAIKLMKVYEPNTHYVPPPPKYGPGSKERCQELMAFGKEGVNKHPMPETRVQDQGDHPETDRFTELVNEMEERVQWLKAMEAVGAGDKYHNLIATQLALKLRDLELIDQKRARDLTRAMKQMVVVPNIQDA